MPLKWIAQIKIWIEEVKMKNVCPYRCLAGLLSLLLLHCWQSDKAVYWYPCVFDVISTRLCQTYERLAHMKNTRTRSQYFHYSLPRFHSLLLLISPSSTISELSLLKKKKSVKIILAKKKFREIIAYFPLIWHVPHRKRRVHFFYCFGYLLPRERIYRAIP
jgi:hypothetical protein